MASKKETRKWGSATQFALHSVKRTIFIWGIVLGVIALVYLNGMLACFLADWVLPATANSTGWRNFVNDLLHLVFFLLVPASVIGGSIWADEDDKPLAEPDKPTGTV